MIYVRLEGHHFAYEVEDVLKLFYNEEEINFLETEPPEDYRGIFIFNRLYDDKGTVRIFTLLKSDTGGSTEYIHEACDLPDADGEAGKHERVKGLKREVKRQVYIAVSQHLGRSMPWGMLTGIRPAKIVHELMERSCTYDGIMDRLQNYYMISPRKAALLYDIAYTEKKILERTASDMVGLYIGIPFCTTRCLYCSFTSNPTGKNPDMVKRYLAALEKEISSTGEMLKALGRRIQSIYIGGGTPTSLDAGQLEKLLAHIEDTLDLGYLEEYTLEAGRPDTIDLAKLEAIRKSRADRISVNPQTMNDDTLKIIGRDHTAEDVVRVFGMARDMGFNNINMDVIIGLPGEDKRMFRHTMTEIEKLGPDSLTVHTMAVKRASRLNEDREKYAAQTDAQASEMIEMAGDIAASMGLRPYYLYRQKNMVENLENIGYSRPGLESIYNIQIMEEKQSIIALGAGAITKVVFPSENRIERAFNVKNVEEYINRLDEMLERKRKLLFNA